MPRTAIKLAADGEQSVPLPFFVNQIAAHANEEILPANLEILLNKKYQPGDLREESAKRDYFRKVTWKGRAAVGGDDRNSAQFDMLRHLPRLKPANPQTDPQLHYFVKIWISATDNNVDTGPSQRNSKALPFLVISETELLAQVGLEEELLSERLEKVYEKLKNARTILSEQMSKLSSGDPALVSDIAGRWTQASKGVSDGLASTSAKFMAITRAHPARELEFNRVKFDKILNVANNIVDPLDRILAASPGGGFPHYRRGPAKAARARGRRCR